MIKYIYYIVILMFALGFLSCEKNNDNILVEDITVKGGEEHEYLNKKNNSGKYNYEWDFGDGSSSTEENPIHKYIYPGRYVINVSVYNKRGKFLSKNKYYIVTVEQNYRPRINEVKISHQDYDYLYKDIEMNIGIVLTDEQLKVKDEYKYKFVIGSETFESENQWNNYTFADTGNYDISFQMTDKNGISGTFDTIIHVGGLFTNLFLKVPETYTSQLGYVTERYIFYYESEYSYNRDLQDVIHFPGDGHPLISNGEIYHYYGEALGYDYWSLFDPYKLKNLSSISNNEYINQQFDASDWDTYGFPQEYDEFFVIVVLIGSNGKAYGSQQLNFTPGTNVYRTINLTYTNYVTK